MNEYRFLHKLRAQGKLTLTEPSEPLQEAHLQKSAHALSGARLLQDAGLFEEAVSLAYYAMYHALTALLMRCGIKCENHTASNILLKELFQEPTLAAALAAAKEERIDKQYYATMSVTKAEIASMIGEAERFATMLRTLINRLRSEDIPRIRKEFEAIGS